MRRTRLLWLAIISLVGVHVCVVGVREAKAARRPLYGGTLRVEMRERVNSMDPRSWSPGSVEGAATERLLGLVFDRLVRLDDRGQPQPALATSWQHDANFTHWQFQLRAGVRFHDGSPLTPVEVVSALQTEDAAGWPVSVSGGGIAFEFKAPRPNLLVELSTGRSFVFHPTQETVFGTGTFRIADWQSQKHLALVASEEYWAGRPFVDRVEIALGITPQQQMTNLELGKADVVELAPNLPRRATQNSATREWSSSPIEMLALIVSPRGSATYDPRFTQALSLAIDRAAIVNVLLQRQGEPAGSLLPQWISGYAFLFPTAPNLEQAKQIRAMYPHSPLQALGYDASDPVAATIAQRIAVNARDAGVNLTVTPEITGGAQNYVDVHLVHWRIQAPDAQQALRAMLVRMSSDESGMAIPLETAEQRYAAERAAIDSGMIIPLAFIPESYAVGAQVRDWMPPRWGGWRLEDVWLDVAPHAGEAASGNGGGTIRP
jgi:peptide/nickel transport system substrate-binding protein